MRRIPLRKLSLLLSILLVASTLFIAPTARAQSAVRNGGAEAGFLASLNQQRAAGGLAPLTMNGSMSSAANGWALQMVNGSFLAHASDIVTGTPGGWSKVGENVGRGQSVASLTSAFMASPGHRANIMEASYTHVGIAVYAHPTDGRMYTTHRFAALGGAAPVAAVVAAPTAVPIPPTAAPVAPTAVPVAPTAVPIPPTAVPIPPTAVPVAPTAVPLDPTPEPLAPTPEPVAPTPEPTATAVPPTPVPATPVPIPPTATAVPATPAPPAPTSVPPTVDTDLIPDFGSPPEQLAFVDPGSVVVLTQSKLDSKLAKPSSAEGQLAAAEDGTA